MPRPLHRRKKSWANLLLVIPAIAIAGCISFGLLWLIQQFQSLRCPSGTFLSGSDRFASIIQLIPAMIASIPPGCIVANWLAHVGKSARNFFDRAAATYSEPGYYKSQRQLLVGTVVVFACAMPLSFGAAFSQFCLAQEGVSYQPWPWSGLRHYFWNDVSAIETNCARGSKGGWDTSFVMILRDGARFDIMEWPKHFGAAYPTLSRALHSVPFLFDSSGVRFGCNVPYVNLLVERP